MNVALCVLTLNAEVHMPQWARAVHSQSLQPKQVLVIDSSSTDGTTRLATDAGFTVKVIDRAEFGHGRTRQYALTCLRDYDVVTFMTQDAILNSTESLERLVDAFADPSVVVAYGRQLPHPGAGPIASHARYYNYPQVSETRYLVPGSRPGLAIAFCSDSFAAYRAKSLLDHDGFPEHVAFGEDMYVAAKALMRGNKLAYVAEATVFHSHDYSLAQDFRRYFDTGVFHKQEAWLLTQLGGPEGRGAGFVRSELHYLLRHAPHKIPEAILRVWFRYGGYRAGRAENLIPACLKRRWSMYGSFSKRR